VRCLWSTRGADLTWRGRRSADHRCSQAGCQRVARDGRCLSALSSGSCSSNARPCQFRWRGRCLALGIPRRRPQPRGAVSVAARASQGCPRSARRLRRPWQPRSAARADRYGVAGGEVAGQRSYQGSWQAEAGLGAALLPDAAPCGPEFRHQRPPATSRGL